MRERAVLMDHAVRQVHIQERSVLWEPDTASDRPSIAPLAPKALNFPVHALAIRAVCWRLLCPWQAARRAQARWLPSP